LTTARKWPAIGGLVGPAGFIAAWSLLGDRASGYEPVTDAISQLAATGAATRTAMTAGLVALGAGVGVHAVALRDHLPGYAWMAAAATGLSALGVAAFPLGGSVRDAVHGAFAGAGYVSLAALPILAARPLAARGDRSLARLSTATGVLTAVCLAATVLDGGDGLLQRVGLTAGHLWIMASAGAVFGGDAPAPTEP